MEVLTDKLEYKEGMIRVARRGRREDPLQRARDEYEGRATNNCRDGKVFQRRRFDLGSGGGFAALV